MGSETKMKEIGINATKLEAIAAGLDILQYVAVPLLEMIAEASREVEEDSFEICVGYNKTQFGDTDMDEVVDWASGTEMQDELREWAKKLA